MPICQNCGYELVLLSSRPKYKCALCSRLYKQRDVESKAFRDWNKRQRENDIHEIELEINQKERKLIENRILKGFRLLFKQKKPKLKLSPEERRKRLLERKRKWASENPEKIKAIRDKYLKNHREDVYDYLKKWREIKQYESRLKQRLAFWRGKQRNLTLQFIKNEPYKLSSKEIEKLLPTSALTQLLVV